MAKKSHPLQNLALVSHIGLVMIVPILGGLYFGRWLDNKFNTQPIFLFIFIILGVGSSFVNLFKVATKGTPNKKRK